MTATYSLTTLSTVLSAPSVTYIGIRAPGGMLSVLVSSYGSVSSGGTCTMTRGGPCGSPSIAIGLSVISAIRLLSGASRRSGIVVANKRNIKVVAGPNLRVPVNSCTVGPMPHHVVIGGLSRGIPSKGVTGMAVSVPRNGGVTGGAVGPGLNVVSKVSILKAAKVTESVSDSTCGGSVMGRVSITITSSVRSLVFIPNGVNRGLTLGRLGVAGRRIVRANGFINFVFSRTIGEKVAGFAFFNRVNGLVGITKNVFSAGRTITSNEHRVVIARTTLYNISGGCLRVLFSSGAASSVVSVLSRLKVSIRISGDVTSTVRSEYVRHFSLSLGIVLISVRNGCLGGGFVVWCVIVG